ncbi:hypothetical protein MF672_046980 [Actinomadura sp. ATCC 31491]|uniref:Uncharacterized protein n=1 Tax=Actinomadura luzonensis TaxID=2805427 RepID=A0ABT0G9L9_9ACTN|nr:hypothetical protein [Actinomadura luzonensis]MCK2221300.1 hypothetical protein [Actinomadura luzonensis]
MTVTVGAGDADPVEPGVALGLALALGLVLGDGAVLGDGVTEGVAVGAAEGVVLAVGDAVPEGAAEDGSVDTRSFYHRTTSLYEAFAQVESNMRIPFTFP